MGEPALNRNEAPRQESEPSKPELRLVEREMSPEQADSLIDRMVEEYEESADETTKEMATEAKAIDELSEKEGVALTAEEANDNARITEQAEAAAGRLRTEIAAAFGSDIAGLESQLRSLDQQLEAAMKVGDGTKVKELEARREQVDAERKQMMAKDAAPKEAAKGPEASVVPDFGQLLDHLSPEAQKAAAKNYEEADETAYGGLASKGMTPDGVVRLGYKDGTIVEVFPGGETRSNLPGATGAEKIPDVPAWMTKEVPPGPGELSEADRAGIELAGVLVLEGDIAKDKEELAGIKDEAGKERADYLNKRIAAAEETLARKNTPEGLAKEVADLNQSIAEEESDMNLAPEADRAGHAARIEQWKGQVKTLEDRAAALKAEKAAVEQEKAPEKPPALERKARMLQLEDQMRGLEQKRKDAATPEEKLAAEQDLEKATKEWDALRKDWTEADEKEAREAYEKEMKQKRILDLENEMRALEQQYAKAETPDQKAAIARDLEAKTREWDSLRKADTGKGQPAAVEQAAALVAAAETIAAAAGTMADTAEKTQELEKAKEAEKAALAKSPSSYAGGGGEGWGGGGGGGGSHGGGGGGGGKDDGQFFKKVAEEWNYWEKLLGGWAKKG